MTDSKARDRARSRRPIEDHEIEDLEALGSLLGKLQRHARLTDRDLAAAAQLSERHLARLRAGTRRTRATTLGRLANAFAPRLDVDPCDLHRQLVTTAGRALAPPSEFEPRIERRRQRKRASAEAKEATRQKRIARFQERFGDDLEALTGEPKRGEKAYRRDRPDFSLNPF